jgi:photosystem II stability/assembly factor-like uncharacterized protein
MSNGLMPRGRVGEAGDSVNDQAEGKRQAKWSARRIVPASFALRVKICVNSLGLKQIRPVKAVTTRNRLLPLAATILMLMTLVGCEPPLPPLQPSRLVIRPWDQLYGVTIKPGTSDCYAVGADGLLLTSHDGGRTWSRRHLNEGQPGTILHQDLDLYAIGFAPDGKAGWIVGELGLVLATSDGGKNWVVQHSGTTNRLLALAVVSQEQVVAVGDHGEVMWTDNGGQHWNSKVYSNLTYYDVAFSDSSNGWIVGEFQTILHSADGGKTWEVQRGGKVADFTIPPYFTVVPQGAQSVLVAGQSGVYSTSKDGGKTWQDSKVSSERSIYAAAANGLNSAGQVWMAGAEGTIFEGVPGGEWHLKDPTFEDLTAIASSPHLGLAVGLGGTILRTVNGEDWNLIGEQR